MTATLTFNPTDMKVGRVFNCNEVAVSFPFAEINTTPEDIENDCKFIHLLDGMTALDRDTDDVIDIDWDEEEDDMELFIVTKSKTLIKQIIDMDLPAIWECLNAACTITESYPEKTWTKEDDEAVQKYVFMMDHRIEFFFNPESPSGLSFRIN